MIFCANCGRRLGEGSKFCGGCGRPISSPLTLGRRETEGQGFFSSLLQGTPEQQAERSRRKEYDKKVVKFYAKYYGGHPGYPAKDNYPVGFSLDDNTGTMVIGKAEGVIYDDKYVLKEAIPYQDIISIGNQKEEHHATLGAIAPVGFGYAGIAGESKWARRALYTYITYRASSGATFTLQFVFDNPEVNQAELFRRISR